MSKTKFKLINLNPEQVQFLTEEMVLLLDAEDYAVESKIRAAEILKKLKGRTSNEQGD